MHPDNSVKIHIERFEPLGDPVKLLWLLGSGNARFEESPLAVHAT
jgi:hypothetical protein